MDTNFSDKLHSVSSGPGVYLMKNDSGEIIYVGKAKNLRTRARSYFYGDNRRTLAQMLRDLQDQALTVVSGFQRIQDLGQVILELHVDDRADDLGNLSDL